MKRLPVLRPFDIQSLGWLVEDARTLDINDRFTVESRWIESCTAFVDRENISRDNTICDFSSPIQERLRQKRFADAKEIRPELDDEEFDRTDRGVYLRFHSTSVNDTLFLGISRGGEWVGGIHLGKFGVESVDARKIVTTAMIWVAVTPERGVDETEAHLTAIRYLIQNDLELADGRMLDIIGYNYVNDPAVPLSAAQGKVLELYAGLARDYDATPDSDTGDIFYRRKQVRLPR